MRKLLLALSLMSLLSACKWTVGTRGNIADAVEDAIEAGEWVTFHQTDETATQKQVQDDIPEPDAWYSKDISEYK